MKRKIRVELDAEAIAAIDAVRGEISRSEYLDRLLKRYQGVTLPHTSHRECSKQKRKQ